MYETPVPSVEGNTRISLTAEKISDTPGILQNARDCNYNVRRSLEHHAGDNRFWLVSTLNLKENNLRVAIDLQNLFLFINLTRGLTDQWLFRVSPCHEGNIHLQTFTSSPVPTAQQSASLTTIPDVWLST
ncbi:hypothetical protein TNCV_1636991 [Trichonephila clavipes]|nr:hypothetical protein TNCV_1636991 [Trichonephila clavipes]